MNRFEHNGQALTYATLGAGDTAFLWGPGWGQDHRTFLSLAERFSSFGTHYLIDFPGFGASPAPSSDWSVGDYAALVAAFIDTLPKKRVIWVGHSFGGRVGIKLAAIAPAKIQAMILISAAGLPRKRTVLQQAKFFLRSRLFKLLKGFARNEAARDKLRERFGSTDYKNAGPLRGTFIKVISENLSADARAVSCPTILIYGDKDTETPPDIGAAYQQMIRGSVLHILPGADHYSVIAGAQHQTLLIMKEAFSTWV